MRPQPIGDTEKDVIMDVNENNNVEKESKIATQKKRGGLVGFDQF